MRRLLNLFNIVVLNLISKIKSIYTISVIFFIAVSNIAIAFPTSCPPASAFSHVPGKLWKLDPSYISKGWDTPPSAPDISSMKKLPANQPANVTLISMVNTVPIECFYNTPTGYFVRAESDAHLTKHDLQLILNKNHNFHKGLFSIIISCDTTNGRIRNDCSWNIFS